MKITAFLRHFLLVTISGFMISSCVTAPQNRTRVYSGSPRQAAEVATISSHKNPGGWAASLETVDGVEIKDTAEVLPGNHKITACSSNLQAVLSDAGAHQRQAKAAGTPPEAFNRSGFSMQIHHPDGTTEAMDLNDPIFVAAIKRQRAATMRTLTQTLAAGKSYVLRCDATGHNIRLEETAAKP